MPLWLSFSSWVDYLGQWFGCGLSDGKLDQNLSEYLCPSHRLTYWVLHIIKQIFKPKPFVVLSMLSLYYICVIFILKLWYSAAGNANMQPLENSWAASYKVKSFLTKGPAIPLLGIFKRNEIYIYTKTYAWMFIAT